MSTIAQSILRTVSQNKLKSIGAAVALSAASFGACKFKEGKEGYNKDYEMGSRAESLWRNSLPTRLEFNYLLKDLADSYNIAGPKSEHYKQIENKFLDYLKRELNTHPALEGYRADVGVLFEDIDASLYNAKGSHSEEYRSKFKKILDNLGYYVIRYKDYSDSDTSSLFNETAEKATFVTYGVKCSRENVIKYLIEDPEIEGRIFQPYNTNNRGSIFYTMFHFISDNPWYEGEVFRVKTKFELEYLREELGDNLSTIDCLKFQNEKSEIAARTAALNSDDTNTILNTVRYAILSDEKKCKKLMEDINNENSSGFLFYIILGGAAILYWYSKMTTRPNIPPPTPPNSEYKSGISCQNSPGGSCQ